MQCNYSESPPLVCYDKLVDETDPDKPITSSLCIPNTYCTPESKGTKYTSKAGKDYTIA